MDHHPWKTNHAFLREYSNVNNIRWRNLVFWSFSLTGETSTTLPCIHQIATRLCPRGDPRSSADSNSIKVPFICQGGPSNRLGRERESELQRKLQGLLNSTEVPPLPGPAWIHHLCRPPPSSPSSPSSHMFLPPTNVRSKPPPPLPPLPPPPPPRHTSQRRRIKKTHKSFPWLPSGLPGQERSGRENSEKNRGGERLVGKGRKEGGGGGGGENVCVRGWGARREDGYIFFLF